MLTKLQRLPRVTSRAFPNTLPLPRRGQAAGHPHLWAERPPPPPGARGCGTPTPRHGAARAEERRPAQPRLHEQVATSRGARRSRTASTGAPRRAEGPRQPPAGPREPLPLPGGDRPAPSAAARPPRGSSRRPPPRGPRPAADKGRRGRYSPNKVRAMAPAGAGRAARGWHWRGGAHGTAAGRARGARRGEAVGAGAAGAAPGPGRGGTRGAEGAAAGPGAAPVSLLAACPRSVRPAASGSHLAPPLGPPPAARPACAAAARGTVAVTTRPPPGHKGKGPGAEPEGPPGRPRGGGAAGRAAGGRGSARAPAALLGHRLGAARSRYKRKSGLVSSRPCPGKNQAQLFGAGREDSGRVPQGAVQPPSELLGREKFRPARLPSAARHRAS